MDLFNFRKRQRNRETVKIETSIQEDKVRTNKEKFENIMAFAMNYEYSQDIFSLVKILSEQVTLDDIIRFIGQQDDDNQGVSKLKARLYDDIKFLIEFDIFTASTSKDCIIDLIKLYDYIVFDGEKFIYIEENLVIDDNPIFELGCIFEIGRIINNNRVVLKNNAL